MIRARAAALIVAAATIVAVASGCQSDAPPAAPPNESAGPLPEGVVARVGPGSIHGESVGRIAALQRIDLHAARDLAVRDALFARGAEARGLDVAADVRSVLARRLLRSFRADAEKVPPTSAELTEAAERREQRGHVPAALVAPELLADDIWNARAYTALTQFLAQHRYQTERSADADALLALVNVER